MSEPLPTPIGAKAAKDLRFIRDAMERASQFTAVPGWGGVGMGAIAFVAGGLSGLRSADQWWLLCWLGAAPVAIAVGMAMMYRKARLQKVPLTGAAGRRFSLGMVPPLAAGAALTGGLWMADLVPLLPGVWLLMYGTGVVTAGVNSVPAVPLMGLGFMVLGTLALLVPVALARTLLVVGFGGLHVIFGWLIIRRYGG